MRWLVIPVQLFALGAALAASIRRRPQEAALLVGVVAMFCFSLPANYYYVILALVPAVVLRAAMTAPRAVERVRHWVVLSGFALFWCSTLLAPRMFNDDIVYDHFICVALLTFLAGWIALWLPWRPLLAAVRARANGTVSTPGGTTG
jgi:protein-S-isoprenylcysteine O-methyltransferase Ste14